jgi:hypothetical protein
MSADERAALERSAAVLQAATDGLATS